MSTRWLGGLFVRLLGGLSLSVARADNIFVANEGIGTIGQYSTVGAPVNPVLISGLSFPEGIAVAGSDLFVVNNSGASGTIGKYTTTGAEVNAALVSGLSFPRGIALAGSDLFVVNSGGIGEYDAITGAPVNPALVSGLPFGESQGIAVSGSDLFVTIEGSGRPGDGTVGEYTTAGAVVNAALISGLSIPRGIAVSGSDLFVANSLIGTIGEYTTTGETVNPALISGLGGISFIAIGPVVPEPSTLALLGAALAGLSFCMRRRISR